MARIMLTMTTTIDDDGDFVVVVVVVVVVVAADNGDYIFPTSFLAAYAFIAENLKRLTLLSIESRLLFQ